MKVNSRALKPHALKPIKRGTQNTHCGANRNDLFELVIQLNIQNMTIFGPFRQKIPNALSLAT